MDHARLDVEFEQMLTNLKPYVIKIQQQSGLLMHRLLNFFCQILSCGLIVYFITYRTVLNNWISI